MMYSTMAALSASVTGLEASRVVSVMKGAWPRGDKARSSGGESNGLL